MKTVFVGPQGIRAGWRFVIFVFLLFGFSKLFFWCLTTLFHYQEHVGWYPTDFLLEGMLSFGAALLAASIMSKIERRTFPDYGLPWRAMFRKHLWQGTLWGFAASLLMIVLLRLFGAEVTLAWQQGAHALTRGDVSAAYDWLEQGKGEE